MMKTLLWMVGLAVSSAQAQTSVADPWVRATVVQQQSSALFARLTSARGGRLVAARSPVAASVELHEMSMDRGVMRMRALPDGLDLPAGKEVALAPGRYHLMLMDLKRQLRPGETVAVTLVVEGADHKRETVEVQAPVRALGAGPPPAH